MKKPKDMTCPSCASTAAGRIGRNRYYCGECCREWTDQDGKLKIFTITPEGKIYNLKLRLNPAL